MEQGSSNTPSEVTIPMELPKNFDGASTRSINSKYKNLIAFIDVWKQNNKGRMNWSAWEGGKKKGLFSEHSNSQSLKNKRP